MCFMDIEEFKLNRIEGRKRLLEKIVDTLKSQHPYAIHIFGSGTTGFKDEFSDIDIWVTFEDDKTGDVLKNLNKIFRNIAPVLLRHYSKSWSPVGGSANSVIHDTDYGPFVVDYYFSRLSQTVIKEDSKVLFGNDSLKRGEWRLNKMAGKDIHDSHTLKKDINLMLVLMFIGIKGIVRKWENDDFLNTIRTVHYNFRKRYAGKIKPRRISLSFKSNYRLLSDLYKISNKRQRRAIFKIRSYEKQVEALYKQPPRL